MDTLEPQTRQSGYWAEFPATYRAEQCSTIAQWLVTGESGAVVGLGGTGKSNLTGFIASRPEIISEKLPGAATDYCFPLLDINSLPTVTTVNFYRGMLYALQAAAASFDPRLAQGLLQFIAEPTNLADPLALYFALQRAHGLLIQGSGKKVIWLIDRFDEACLRLESGTLNSLRHLRDNNHFRGKLSYVVFTRHPLAWLRNPAEYDEFHEIIISNTCWVGAMVARDAHWVLRQMAERHQITLNEVVAPLLIELSGGWPAFLKAASIAFAHGQLPLSTTLRDWVERLLAQPVFLRNCQELWSDCSDAERGVLMAIANERSYRSIDLDTVITLGKTGLLTAQTANQPRRIFSPIFAAFIKRQKTQQMVGIKIDPRTDCVLRNGLPLQAELAPHERRLLIYFIQHSGEVCEKDVLISHIWAEEVSDENLTQLVKRLREKLELNATSHTYIQTVRGRGYRFVQPEV